ncbi:hypothetical protein JOQ06_005595 [Pogonophryne albipinna]|uniref:Uncharacterized protein n=1 Tax=Pogonophryne albipinna TaxID=1090488 RepID=A0AAD6BJ59_9TELE|nr:hypothetical protein JOQ06_005595 [Pogonophryne albipinna]
MSASSLTVSSSSSRGSLASSRGSLASSRGSLSSISFSDIYGFPQYEGGAGEEPHLRYLLQTDPPSHSKNKRSHDPPQSLASLSSRSSLSSLSPPGSPMDTPYLPPPDCPLTQMTEEYMEQAGGRGLLEGLRDAVCPPTGTTGVTLRGNSANRSVRRARRVSVSEEALATDSGVFEAWGRRTEESDEISFIKDLTSVSEPTQIHLGLLWELSSQSLRLHLLQLKSLSRCVVREGFKVYVKVQLLPLDSARGALTASFLQISVCSLGGESQEETLGSAQLGLSECEGGVEMIYHWLRVTMLNGAEKSQRRHTENQDALLSRSSSQLEGGEAAQQRRGEASERRSRWTAACSNSTAFTPPTEGPCAEGVTSRGPSGKVKVEKGTMTEALIPDPVRVRPKERGGPLGPRLPLHEGQHHRPVADLLPRGPEPVRLQVVSQRQRQLHSTKENSVVRNTLERRTLRYKQQSYRSSLAEQPTRTSLDLELDLQACRSRQKQLLEELSFLRDLKLRLEAPQAQDPPELRDERFCSLLREAQRQAGQSQQQQRQEEAAERRLRKASKEVLQMRGQSQKEPLPVQTFR